MGPACLGVRFAENFPLAVENLLRPTEFRREFFTEMIKPPEGINPGYRHLAKLMMRRLCWTVMTTNFDHNIIESLREPRPPIREIVEVNRTADDLVRFNVYNRCQVVYLHGAVEYYRDKNLVQEVQRLEDQLVRRVKPVITDSPLIVIGYRGSEPSIMSHLLGEGIEESGAYRQGIFWCLLRGLEAYLTSDEVNPILRIKGEPTAEERPAYPPRALTELIVNLLVHREYEGEAYSHIEFEPGQHLRFTNPGGLMLMVYARV